MTKSDFDNLCSSLYEESINEYRGTDRIRGQLESALSGDWKEAFAIMYGSIFTESLYLSSIFTRKLVCQLFPDIVEDADESR